jgi:hypothetical protein
MFASALPESLMGRLGKIHVGRPLTIRTRKELLQTIRPSQHRYLRADTGDLPDPPAIQDRRPLIMPLREVSAAAAVVATGTAAP